VTARCREEDNAGNPDDASKAAGPKLLQRTGSRKFISVQVCRRGIGHTSYTMKLLKNPTTMNRQAAKLLKHEATTT
jgi:hypothetical protein